jgi:DNA primase
MVRGAFTCYSEMQARERWLSERWVVSNERSTPRRHLEWARARLRRHHARIPLAPLQSRMPSLVADPGPSRVCTPGQGCAEASRIGQSTLGWSSPSFPQRVLPSRSSPLGREFVSPPSATCPALTDDFRRAIDEIKLRVPIEDVVREHVPALRKSGPLWVACCPFHDEKTPSFKVDPRRGTWHCFGSCAEGGDQISFVEKITGVGFQDALEILASRSGVELPQRSGRGRVRDDDPALDVLTKATRYYRDVLASEEGRAARNYLTGRGLNDETALAFGLGWAPASGQALVEHSRRERLPWEFLESGGLVRKSDRGRPYDFFRGRLMIPIRDIEGRTVGFGGRRLGGADDGPKYINTPETPLFKKGKLVYALDQALAEARAERHLILVEGYTDVMAAHQVGLKRVGAVLGTSTTTDHAARIRRCGARRISLVFDGDEAGRKAGRRALAGLLPLDALIEVVTLPAGTDPCDLLLEEGAEAFLARVDDATEWFQFLLSALDGLSGAALSEEVDGVMALLAGLPRPVHRQSLLKELADHLGLPVDSLREQWRTSVAGRRRSVPVEAPSPSEPMEPVRKSDPGLDRAFADAIGAVLLDNSLVPLLKPYAGHCEDEDLRRVLEIILEMYEEVDTAIDVVAVLTALEDHPARTRVAGLAEHANLAGSPKELLEGGVEYMRRRGSRKREAELRARAMQLESRMSSSEATPVAIQDARGELEDVLAELTTLLRSEKSQSEKSPEESDDSLLSHSLE